MTLTETYQVKSLNSLSFWSYVEEKWNPGSIQFPSRSTTPSGIYDCMCTLSFFFFSPPEVMFPHIFLPCISEDFVRVITYFYHCLHKMCPDFRPGYKRAFSSCILSHSQAGPPFFNTTQCTAFCSTWNKPITQHRAEGRTGGRKTFHTGLCPISNKA